MESDKRMSKIGCWIEAMRLRTLPVSVAGVVAAVGYAVFDGCVNWTVSALCLAVAVLAQISSNFANEYYDFKAGLDKPGREGPRRGVTEGDITPGAMKAATFAVLGAACLTGLALLLWGPWWLILVGVAIAVGVVAYSTGPYPLSHHGLGEVAVLFFFGIIPVNMTYYIQAGCVTWPVFLGSVSIGLMGANVLIVNNYRDREVDAAVGKRTLAVILGGRVVRVLYVVNGVAAVALMAGTWLALGAVWPVVPALYLTGMAAIFAALCRRHGAALNPLLGMTAVEMLVYAILFLTAAATA